MAEDTDLETPPGYYREQKGLTLAQVRALGREAAWLSDRGECYAYFPSEGRPAVGLLVLQFQHTQGLATGDRQDRAAGIPLVAHTHVRLWGLRQVVGRRGPDWASSPAAPPSSRIRRRPRCVCERSLLFASAAARTTRPPGAATGRPEPRRRR
jgi:hypothetical protein